MIDAKTFVLTAEEKAALDPVAVGWLQQVEGQSEREALLGIARLFATQVRAWAAPFEPTVEEIAACPMLAEVRGMAEREAVVLLAKRADAADEELAKSREMLRLTTNDRRDLREQVEALARDVEHEAERAHRAERNGNPQRPRVGPWISEQTMAGRYDDRGACVGSVGSVGDEWTWFVVVPFGKPRHGGKGERLTEAQARDNVDAMLATWADIDNAATTCACPEPRDIMYGGNAGICEKCNREIPERMWRLHEIKEAWYRAQESGRPQWQQPCSADDLENSWTHVRGALTGEKV